MKFLQGLYRDLLTTFKHSPILGIGCSEVGMQWQKKYCPRCQARIDKGESLDDLYYKHVTACAAAVEAAGKEAGHADVRPMMWADEFYVGYNNQRWVGIEHIPKNVIMGHWQYWSRYQGLAVQDNKTYDGISGLLERGFDVFYVSASFEFNTYLHDLSPKEPLDGKAELVLDSGIYNIADQARWANEHSQKSLPGKVWGGVCATFSQHDIRGWDSSWFAYALQAEYAWGDPKRSLDAELNRFTDNFAATFYGARDAETAQLIASAYRGLDAVKSDIERNNYLIRDTIGEYDIHDNFYIDNDLEASLKLLDELAAHPKGPGKAIAEIRARCENALNVTASFQTKLAGRAANVRNITSLHYLISAAHKMQNHARRTIFLLDLSAATKAKDPAKLADLRNECASLKSDTRVIADEMDLLNRGARLAESPADPSGYHKVLASLDKFETQLKAAVNSVEIPHSIPDNATPAK